MVLFLFANFVCFGGATFLPRSHVSFYFL